MCLKLQALYTNEAILECNGMGNRVYVVQTASSSYQWSQSSLGALNTHAQPESQWGMLLQTCIDSQVKKQNTITVFSARPCLCLTNPSSQNCHSWKIHWLFLGLRGEFDLSPKYIAVTIERQWRATACGLPLEQQKNLHRYANTITMK